MGTDCVTPAGSRGLSAGGLGASHMAVLDASKFGEGKHVPAVTVLDSRRKAAGRKTVSVSM